MTINVKEGPQAQDDFAYGAEHEILSIDILANDLTNSLALWSLEQDNLAVLTEDGARVLLSSGATVWFENGELQYDPGLAFNHLSEGETAVDQFTYAIRMANGKVSWATVTVTITGEDDPIAGVISDGYIAGATIFVDGNQNGILDAGEPNTISDSNGDFTISPGASGALVAIGGTNIDTGLANELILSAPQGSIVINPLTTLIQELVEDGFDATEAETRLQAAFGLSLGISLLSYDILAQPVDDPDALAAQKLATSIAAILKIADQVIPGAQQAVLEELAEAVATASTGGTILDLTDATTLEPIFVAALPIGAEVTSLAASVALATTAIQTATTIAQITTTQLNTIAGTEGADVISAPLGISTLLGLGGDDTFTISQLAGITASINGGSGTDTLLLPGTRQDWNFQPLDALTISGTSSLGTTVVFSAVEIVSIGGDTSGLPIRSTEAGQELFGTPLRDFLDALHPGVILDGTSAGSDVLTGGIDTTVRLSWSDSAIGADFHLSSTGLSGAVDANGGTKIIRAVGNDISAIVTGSDFDDRFEFEAGTNYIFAGAGNDFIWGGSGQDTMNGGAGADTFRVGTGDVIVDFEQGSDRIDLTAFDGDLSTPQRDPLIFLGQQPFSGTPGEFRSERTNESTLVQIDLNGDALVDVQVVLNGSFNLQLGDFIP